MPVPKFEPGQDVYVVDKGTEKRFCPACKKWADVEYFGVSERLTISEVKIKKNSISYSFDSRYASDSHFEYTHDDLLEDWVFPTDKEAKRSAGKLNEQVKEG
jgi:hypothetical protein